MKKLTLLLCCLQISYCLHAQVSNPTETDDPGAAVEFEFNRTKDPSTNNVPKERLLPILDAVNQYFAANPGNKTVSNWTERGPNNVGGRTRALMYDPNDVTQKKVWAGGVDGGLWYTNDITVASPTWNIVSNFWANMSVTCIAYDPSNTQIFYVGTGEGYYNIDAVRGLGIWKTTDGGATWNQLASTNNVERFDYVQKIVVTSTGVVLAASSGRFCNGDGGVQRSTDGGTTWTRVLGTTAATCGASSTGAADIEKGTDGTLYASMGLLYTGGIFKSIDNGITWTSIGGNGFPTTNYARIEIAVAPSNANRLYAMVQNNSTYTLLGIYTSVNKGATWTTCTLPTWFDQSCVSSSSDMTRTQAWYDLILAVDPLNENTLFAGGVDLMKSTNSGTAWTQVSSWFGNCGRQFVHADQHAIVYKPGSSTVGLIGNDGGVFYSSDLNNAAPTFTAKNNGYNVTQFYACAAKPSCFDEYFLAGAQDNGTHRFLNAGMNSTATVHGGDGGFCFIDQTNPSYQIAATTFNNFYLTTNGWTTQSQILSSNNTIGSFINPADYDDLNHILYSSYSTSQISRVAGITTTPAVSQITISGMTALASHVRVSPYSSVGSSTLFVGTQNGKLYKVTNAQGTPTSTSIGGTVAPWNTSVSISCVEIGATENDIVVTFFNFGVISVWSTTDGGANWANKEGNLPDMPIRWAMYNPNNLSEVYLATEVGVWSTTNITAASPNWVANNIGLANVRVDMFQLRKSDNLILAATHGRGLFTSSSFGGSSGLPYAEFSATSTSVCQGSSTTFSDLSCGSATSWLWTFPGGTPANSNLPNPTVTYNTVGTYSVTLTAINAQGNNVMAKTNYINVTSATANAGPDITLTCTTPSSTIGTANIVGNTYAWSPGTNLSSTSIAQPVATSASTTTYTVTVTNSNGCTASDAVLVTVNKALPTANAGPDITLTCTTPSSTIGTANIIGNTYAWNPSTNLSSAIIAQPNASSLSTTTYTVTVTGANGCTASDAVLVTVNKALPTANAGPDITLTCTTPSSTIGTANIVGNTYAWNPSTNLSSAIIAQPNASSLSTTTYTVTVTGANGCTASDAVLVTVNKASPTANAGPDITLTCTTPSSTIGTANIVGNTYAWNPSTNLSSAIIAQPNASSLSTTTYTVTVTGANGCTASDAVLVTVNKALPTANAGPDITLTCTTPSSTIGTANIVGNTYAWNPGTNLSSAIIAQPNASSLSTTTYTVTVTGANGCTASDAVLVTVNKASPTANAGPDITLTCTIPSSTIGTANIVGNTYAWNPGTNLSSAIIAQPNASSLSTTTYTVTVTGANGCTASDAVLVTVNKALPTANAGSDITLTCATPSLIIGTANIVGNTYAWNPSTNLSSAIIAQPNASSLSTTTYTVTVTGANGCTASDAVLVTVIPCNTVLSTKLFIQGYYTGSNSMTATLMNQGLGSSTTLTDSILVEIHEANAPYNLQVSQKVALYTDGTAVCNLPPLIGNHYIVLIHRNSIETWSANAIPFTSNTSYDFSNVASKAFGSNQIQMESGVFAIYNGDINQDGYIDGSDYPDFDFDSQNNIQNVYVVTDLNGDGYVDASDYPIFDLNSQNNVQVLKP